jgi:hypothetical protein
LNMGNNVGSGSNSPPSVVQVRTIVKHSTTLNNTVAAV